MRLSDPFSLKSQRNQLLQVSHQPYQDLKVGSNICSFCTYSVPLEPLVIRPKRTNRKPQSMVEIRLKVDISHDVAYKGLNHVIENYDCMLYLRSSYMKILHLYLGSKKVHDKYFIDANNLNCFKLKFPEKSGKCGKLF